jgi:hypothetical protein
MAIHELSRDLVLKLKVRILGVGIRCEAFAVKTLDELKDLFVDSGICSPNLVREVIDSSLDQKLTYASFTGAFMEIKELDSGNYQILRGY